MFIKLRMGCSHCIHRTTRSHLFTSSVIETGFITYPTESEVWAKIINSFSISVCSTPNDVAPKSMSSDPDIVKWHRLSKYSKKPITDPISGEVGVNMDMGSKLLASYGVLPLSDGEGDPLDCVSGNASMSEAGPKKEIENMVQDYTHTRVMSDSLLTRVEQIGSPHGRAFRGTFIYANRIRCA